MNPVRPFIFFAALVGLLAPIEAQPNADAFRAESEKLLEKAKQAKTEGHPEEADALFRQSKKLEAQARESQDGKEPGDQGAEARRAIGELHRAGKHDAAERLERRLAEGRERKGALRRELSSSDERFRHVMEAVKHLHAAGFHEPAEQLERQANRLREEQSFQNGSADGQIAQSLHEMHAQIDEVRAQVQKMARSMDELRAQLKKQSAENVP